MPENLTVTIEKQHNESVDAGSTASVAKTDNADVDSAAQSSIQANQAGDLPAAGRQADEITRHRKKTMPVESESLESDRQQGKAEASDCLLYTSPSPRDS